MGNILLKKCQLVFLGFCLLFLACSQSEKTAEKTERTTEAAVVDEQARTKDNAQVNEEEKVIVFFGNSITAGYNLDPEEAFPALIKDKIDSLGLNYEVINAGLSGETTASGKNRVEWILKQNVDIFILELGANDGLRGIDLEETKQNLQDIIDIVRANNAETKIILAGMQIPPSMGADYAGRFREIFPELAEENQIPLIPFLLKDVGGEPDLNLPDGIHPNAVGHQILADNVWVVLKEVL